MNLKKYVVVGVSANVNAGHVKLDKDQARRRRHAIEAVEVNKDTGAGVYKILRPVQFKNGEQFEYDGEFPKSMAHEVADPKEADVNTETGAVEKKPAAKKNRS